MVVKEFIQLRRDRVSFAMIVMIPVMQLMLFGYAINTTPRNLPTAVLLQEDSDLARSILKALENTAYFRFTREVHDVAEFDNLLLSGKVLFGVEIPRGFERAVRRGDHPALLVAADATDPVAAGSALSALGVVVQTALEHDLHTGDPPSMPFEIRAHARYNPAGSSRLNIVPGLVGTILTMTMLIFTGAVGDPRDRARHHGKPAVDADQAGRDHVRQDHSLRAGRLHPGHADHRHRRAAVRGAGAGQPDHAGAALDAVHHHQSVDRLHLSRPSCRTSCRRCSCR